ncbi:MAG: T9SS type A sorting domain-containing protein [Candidatus Zixiibacteriota bacterium]
MKRSFLIIVIGLMVMSANLFGQTWEPTNGPVGGTVMRLASNSEGALFSGTWLGGMFRSTDNGDSWAAINNGFAGLEIWGIDVDSHGHIFVVTNDNGVFRSVDSGENWAQIGNGIIHGGTSITINQADHIFAAGYGFPYECVYRSFDNGATWEAVGRGIEPPSIQVIESNGETLYAGDDRGNLYRSFDEGDSWARIGSYGIDDPICGITHGIGYVFVSRGTGLYIGTDSGTNWIRISDEPACVLTFIGSDLLIVGADGDIYRSGNFGHDWTGINVTAQHCLGGIKDLLVNSDGHLFVAMNDIGVYRSFDNGLNWSAVDEGLAASLVTSLVTTENGEIFAGTRGQGIHSSIDDGNSWQHADGASCSIWALAVNGGDDIFACSGNNVFSRRISGSNTWEKLLPFPPSIAIMSLAINNSNSIFAGAASGQIYRSDNSGDTWTATGFDSDNSGVYALAVNDDGAIFAGTQTGGVFRSVDGGSNWLPANIGFPNTLVSSIAVGGDGAVFAAVYSGGLYRSPDNGDTWSLVDTNITGSIVFDADHSTIYGRGDDGVYHSTDSGRSWTLIGDELINKDVQAISVDGNGDVFAGTRGHGVFRLDRSALFDSLVVIPLSPDPNPEISTVMQGGTLYRYYQVVDGRGNPRANQNVRIQSGDLEKSFQSGNSGMLTIALSSDSLDMSIGDTRAFAVVSVNDYFLLPGQQVEFDVTLENRRYEKSWDILAKMTAEGGLGAGAAIGPLGIKGAQASITGEGGVGIKLKLLKGEASEDILVFGRRFEAGVGLAFEVGKIEMLGNYRIGAGVAVKPVLFGEQEFTFDEPNSTEQQKVQAGVLLETLNTASAPLSPVTSIIQRAILELILQSSGTQQLVVDASDMIAGGLGIEGEVSIGFETQLVQSSLSRYFNFNLPNAAVNASVLGGARAFNHSIYYDQHPNANAEVFITAAQSFDVSLYEAQIAPHLLGLDIGELLPNMGYHVGGSQTQRVLFNESNNIVGGSICLSADDKEFQSIGEKHTFENVTYYYTPEVMQHIWDTEINLVSMAVQPTQPLFVDPISMNSDFTKAVTSYLSYVYEVQNSSLDVKKEIEDVAIYDISVSVPFEAGIGVVTKLEIGAGITATDTRKYLTAVTKVCNVGKGIFPTESYYDDPYIQSDNRDLEEVVVNILSGVIPLIQDAIDGILVAYNEFITDLRGAVIQTGQDIIDGGSQLVVGAGDFIDGSIGQIIPLDIDWPLKVAGQIVNVPYKCQKAVALSSYKAARVDTTVVMVTAVGRAYQVDVFNPDSTPVYDFPSPLDFKILVTDNDLAETGYASSFRSNLKIHRWDSTLARVVELTSSLSGDTVMAQIVMGGQYFAGVDTIPPDTIAPSYNYLYPENNGSIAPTDSFEIVFEDTGDYSSGLNPWSLLIEIDEDTVSPDMVIFDPYHIRISWLPQHDSVWSEGTHNVRLEIADNAGNAFVLENSFSVAATDVQDDDDHINLPTEYSLSQNYPNPFNPITEIDFALPRASNVKLEIFNIMGQRVASLIDKHLEAGTHTVIWDGSHVASGVYFYRIEASDFVETKKMLLLK